MRRPGDPGPNGTVGRPLIGDMPFVTHSVDSLVGKKDPIRNMTITALCYTLPSGTPVHVTTLRTLSGWGQSTHPHRPVLQAPKPVRWLTSFEQLCDLIEEAGLRVVFWTCPDCPPGFVSWSGPRDAAVPKCEQCGKTGAPR